MGTRFEEVYRWTDKDSLTADALNRRFKDLDDRLSQAEVIRLGETEAFAVVLDRVLGRSEDVIASLRDKLLSITELQWLTANSTTERSLELDASISLDIVEADRALFAPGPFALLTWTGGGPEDYAVVRTLAFDRGIGQWDVRVEAFVGAPGPHSEWQISAVAGSTLAQLALFGQTQAVQIGILEVAEDLAGRHQDVIERQADVAALRGLVAQDRAAALQFRNQAEGFKTTAAQSAQAAADLAASLNASAIAVDAWFFQ